ncbi:MAG: hypothetical protein OXE53_00535, partial [Deltaproteobacteria bacterium]|nr:hypothetical protein [Deltaproteobacteria bacterium]
MLWVNLLAWEALFLLNFPKEEERVLLKKRFMLVAVAAAVVVGLMGLISAAAQATPSATRSFDSA